MLASQKLPLVVAHRGASALAPENTLAAFARAIKDGAEGIEFDVRISRDGVPVVFHDASLHRIAKRRVKVSSLNFEELQAVDVGAWFNSKNPRRADAKFENEEIPSLASVFDFLKGYDGRVYVELKNEAKDSIPLVEAVAKIIRESGWLRDVVLKSFDHEALSCAKQIFPELCCAALFAPEVAGILRKRSRLIDRARAVRADELSLHYSLATAKMTDEARRAGMPVTIWTADHPVWITRAAKTGIYAVITNNPARLLAEKRKITDS